MTKKSLGLWLYSAAHRFHDWELLLPAVASRALGCEFLPRTPTCRWTDVWGAQGLAQLVLGLQGNHGI